MPLHRVGGCDVSRGMVVVTKVGRGLGIFLALQRGDWPVLTGQLAATYFHLIGRKATLLDKIAHMQPILRPE
jgi:hypothetical protein